MKYILNKRILISLLVVLMFLSFSAQAQQKPFKFGFKVSPAIAWLSPDAKSYEQGGSDFAFAWGFTADITLMEHYYLATGFNVSYFSGKLKYPHIVEYESNGFDMLYEGEMQRDYNLRYIEVPMALKMKTNELTNNLLFFGMIGVNTGFNIRAKADEKFNGESIIGGDYNYTEEKVDIKNETTTVKASLLVGAGTEYIIDESISIVLGINFNNGFTNILKGSNTVDPSIDAKAVPYYFELNLGVIF